MLPPPQRSTLFPYTTLFRSEGLHLPDPEAGDQLLRLGEGPVDHGPLASRESDARAFRAGLESLRSEEHTSELQSLTNLVCRLLLEKKEQHPTHYSTNRSKSA